MAKETARSKDGEGKPRRWPPLWVLTTYFAEGLPYSLVRQISTVYFKDHGASLEAVGLTSLYGLPWVLKFLWAPLADAFGTKRQWLLAAEAVLAAAAAAMAFGSSLPNALVVGSVLFLVTAVLSATHDIAVDGFYLEALDRQSQAKNVGFQAMSYRLALIAGGGGVVWLSGVAGWPSAFGLACAMLLALFAYHSLALPHIESPKRKLRELAAKLVAPRTLAAFAGAAFFVAAGARITASAAVQHWIEPARPLLKKIGPAGFIVMGFLAVLLVFLASLSRFKRRLAASESFYARAFIDYLDQKRIGVILTFLVLYRTGEAFLLAMVYPMLKDIGISRAQYGLIYGTFGITASIVGGILGGHLIGRWGLRKVIWPLVLAQNVPNLLYMLLALLYRGLSGHPELGAASSAVVSGFVVLEALGAGMGTSVFMVFIMRTCKPAYKAAHMSIATSIMNISSTFAGVLSGFLAGWLGFPGFFAFTFVATFPGMACIFFLPHLEEKPPGTSPPRRGDG